MKIVFDFASLKQRRTRYCQIAGTSVIVATNAHCEVCKGLKCSQSDNLQPNSCTKSAVQRLNGNALRRKI
jgi:hypothetical protein